MREGDKFMLKLMGLGRSAEFREPNFHLTIALNN